VLIGEYERYERAVAEDRRAARGAVPDAFDAHHQASYLALADGGGWWEYLELGVLTAGGEYEWREDLCRDWFRYTCQLWQAVPEVVGPMELSGCEGQCLGSTRVGRNGLGPPTFYRLAPGKAIPSHFGNTNQRLKCHLGIRAPPKGRGRRSASITVGGERREVGRGDVFCFDDSYLHSIHNGGDESRVVLDVTFWHPKLMALSGGATGRYVGEEAALRAILADVDASLQREERAREFTAEELQLLLSHERRTSAVAGTCIERHTTSGGDCL